MHFVCECAKYLTKQYFRAVTIITRNWEVPGSDLAQNTDYLEILHAFPHSFRANSRRVGLL